MMQKRKLSSLLLISFIVIFAFSYSMANEVTFETKPNVLRCSQINQNISIAPSQEITGFEIVFAITETGGYTPGLSVTWGTAVPTGWYKDIDMSHVDGVAPDTVRMIALRLGPSLPTMAAGSYDVATMHYETDNVCQGVITVSGTEWTWNQNPTGPIVTQFTDLNGDIQSAAVTAGTVTIVNTPPTLTAIPDQTVHWGDAFSITATGSDGDPSGCEELTYSLTTKPTGMTIDENTGLIQWSVPGSAVCTHNVTVRVTDACNATASQSFTICVQNDPPTITCPDDIIIPWGEVASGQFTGDDPDGGPSALSFSKVDFDGPGTVYLNAATGEFSWQTMTTSDYTGTFHLTVAVTDGANLCDPCSPENADTCTVAIEVVAHEVKIAKVHDQILGQFVDVELTMHDEGYENYPMGGFDFLIQYDNSALTFIEAKPGEMVTDCGWEYFTYRTGPFGNCGNACPSGMIKVVAIAEYNNGDGHPECFTNDAQHPSPQLVVLRFLATNDHTFECQYVPVRFVWIDCTDNTISNVAGDVLFISGEVWDYDGVNGVVDNYHEITDFETDFPTIYGAPILCDTINLKTDPYRFIKFFNGGIDFICNDSIDARGDINMDGVSYSIADAVMYARYFVYGLSALYYNPNLLNGEPIGYAGSIAASDVNADGLTLTVADLVYLIRVVVGDAVPYPKEVASVAVDLNYSQNGVLSVPDNVQLGAARVVLRGDVTPQLLADNMELQYAFDGQNTNLLIWSRDGNSFTGKFLQANAEVMEVEMATADGSPVVAKLVPTEYSLSQNYPNPFNPTTTIQFALPVAGDYSLTIYNVQGQVVQQFSGSADAGIQTVEWNATNNASGVYFYRLTAGNFSATKKMVLLK
ncbi:MAG: T9SS type A sorting domain-containing protein [Candidatus Zixiibacteriota bacterium]|jgi:hypothetical protein